MKRFLSLLALILLVAVVAYPQVQTVNGVTFNQAKLWFSNANCLPATANDTTTYLPFTPSTNVGWVKRSNDSMNVLIYYQLRSSTTGATGTATLIDSCVSTTQSDVATIGKGLAIATLIGADQVRFIFDYNGATTGTGGNDGSANLFRFYYMLYRP